MTDLIVFSVGNNRYALNIENIQRIIQSVELTEIPNAHELIDGMMSYEGKVIKVLNFRKLIALPTYEDELQKMFAKLKVAHQNWVDELKRAIYNGTPFTKTTNPRKCELGIWLDGFKSVDEMITATLNELVNNHKQLHMLGAEALEVYNSDVDKAKEIVDQKVELKFHQTMSAIDTFIVKLSTVANSLQKLILYEKDEKYFAIKVDAIEDIAHIEESTIMRGEEEHGFSDLLELEGVLDMDGVLINVIKNIDIPS